MSQKKYLYNVSLYENNFYIYQYDILTFDQIGDFVVSVDDLDFQSSYNFEDYYSLENLCQILNDRYNIDITMADIVVVEIALVDDVNNGNNITFDELGSFFSYFYDYDNNYKISYNNLSTINYWYAMVALDWYTLDDYCCLEEAFYQGMLDIPRFMFNGNDLRILPSIWSLNDITYNASTFFNDHFECIKYDNIIDAKKLFDVLGFKFAIFGGSSESLFGIDFDDYEDQVDFGVYNAILPILGYIDYMQYILDPIYGNLLNEYNGYTPKYDYGLSIPEINIDEASYEDLILNTDLMNFLLQSPYYYYMLGGNSNGLIDLSDYMQDFNYLKSPYLDLSLLSQNEGDLFQSDCDHISLDGNFLSFPDNTEVIEHFTQKKYKVVSSFLSSLDGQNNYSIFYNIVDDQGKKSTVHQNLVTRYMEN